MSSLRQALERHSHLHHPLPNLPTRISSTHNQHNYPLPNPDRSGVSTTDLLNHGRQISSINKDHQHQVIQQHEDQNRSHHCILLQKKKKKKKKKSPGSNASCNLIDTISKDLNIVAADSKLDLNLDAESCSSGSEVHEDLAAMVNEFMEDAEGTSAAYSDPSRKINATHHQEAASGVNHDGSDSVLDEYEGLIRTMQGLMMASSCAADHQGSDQKEDSEESDSEEELDSEEAELRRDVMAALEMVMKHNSTESSDSHAKMLSYGVMRQLRCMGHNAAICKSKWEKALGSQIIPAGEYEYIDVMIIAASSNSAAAIRRRVIVDIDFRAQFELARAPIKYRHLLTAAPSVFVGGPSKLLAMVKAMSEGTRLSLRAMGMHVPPWRKQSYLQAKWFSPYMRTTRPPPATSPGIITPTASASASAFVSAYASGIDSMAKHPHPATADRIVLHPNLDLSLPVHNNILQAPDRRPSSSKKISALACALRLHHHHHHPQILQEAPAAHSALAQQHHRNTPATAPIAC